MDRFDQDFSSALNSIKNGFRMARAGWNGKGMFIFLVPGSTFVVSREPLIAILGEGTEAQYCPHIDMKTADGKIVPWLASQTDLMASDWGIVAVDPFAGMSKEQIDAGSRRLLDAIKNSSKN